MSEENKPEKIKNPGRVAWGKMRAASNNLAKAKELAAISTLLKQQKKNGNTEEIKLLKKDIKIDKETDSKLTSYHIQDVVAFGGLLIATIALYLQYKNNKQQISYYQPKNDPQPTTASVPYNYQDF